MRDSLERTIKPGDVIVYPGRSGSCVWINHAVVADVQENYILTNRITDTWGSSKPFLDPKAYKVYVTERCTILNIDASQLLELAGVN